MVTSHNTTQYTLSSPSVGSVAIEAVNDAPELESTPLTFSKVVRTNKVSE